MMTIYVHNIDVEFIPRQYKKLGGVKMVPLFLLFIFVVLLYIAVDGNKMCEIKRSDSLREKHKDEFPNGKYGEVWRKVKKVRCGGITSLILKKEGTGEQIIVPVKELSTDKSNLYWKIGDGFIVIDER